MRVAPSQTPKQKIRAKALMAIWKKERHCAPTAILLPCCLMPEQHAGGDDGGGDDVVDCGDEFDSSVKCDDGK